MATRLDLVVSAFTRTIVDNESQQRTMLRLSLEADAPSERSCRCGKAGASSGIEDALAPLRAEMTDAAVHRLALAIRARSASKRSCG